MSSVVPIEEFLASMSPEARAMVQRLRRLIREVHPGVVERAERETSSLRCFRGERSADGVLFLASEGNDVLLGFEKAQELPGDGPSRVRITASGAFDEPYFRRLLETAFSNGHQS